VGSKRKKIKEVSRVDRSNEKDKGKVLAFIKIGKGGEGGSETKGVIKEWINISN